ncbi:MAG: hypothetical protein LBB10_02545 [Bifidobacteriaceae bacterium]|jgi:hypothetical protein|nr:hypothetical protein [Bifidobacteriaceae bacterium]
MSKRKIVSIALLTLSVIIIAISGALVIFSSPNNKNTTTANITDSTNYVVINPGILQAIGNDSSITVVAGANDTVQIATGSFKDASGIFADDTAYTQINGFSIINNWSTQTILPTKVHTGQLININTSDMFDVIATSQNNASFDLSSLQNFTNDSTLVIERQGSSAPITISIQWSNSVTSSISFLGFILGAFLLIGAFLGFRVTPKKSRHTKDIEKKPLVHHIKRRVKKLNESSAIEYDISKIDKKNDIKMKINDSKTAFNVNKNEKRVEKKLRKTDKNDKNAKKHKRASKGGYAHMKMLIILCTCAFIITSCSGGVPPINQETSELTPDLSVDRQQSIFSDILDVIQYADNHNNTQYLKKRLYGPEYEIRSAQIVQKRNNNKLSDNAEIPSMTDQIIISNSHGWPRVSGIITKPTADMQSQRLLFITQTTARDNYKLWGLARIFSNTTLPKFNSALDGSQTILPDDETLIKSPIETVKEYANLLQNGQNSKSASQFPSDPFQEQLTTITQTVQQGVSQNGGSQSQEFKPDTANIQGIRTSDGGALIMAQIDSFWKREAGGGRISKPASDEEEALFGNSTATQSILAHYVNVIAIYIPVKNDTNQSIQIIGAERMPVEVKAI